MNLASEVRYNLNILGLAPGATSAEIRSAFRSLARSCHPDVLGGRGAFRFQQISGAYSFLKGLGPEELGCAAPRQKRAEPARQKRAEPAGWSGWTNPFARRRQRQQERRERDEAEAARASRASHQVARQEEERRAALRRERAERALSRGERAMAELTARLEAETDRERITFLLERLNASVAEVRCLALSHLGPLANRPEVLEALAALLLTFPIDDRTARSVTALPLKPESWAFLAQRLERCAARLPDALLTALLGLTRGVHCERKTLEAYLCGARSSGAALILRSWPKQMSLSDAALTRLLQSTEEEVLVPLLLLMKQRFPTVAARHRSRLEDLAEHPVVGVRVWSRSLLNA
ncbi:MAG: J domain-containing protein [Fretibacterium sp.]|nr:J domain-containing protein [Fretibacterium sp.]